MDFWLSGGVELGAEDLHERHAFHDHVEHLPAAADGAHQVVDRDRFAAARSICVDTFTPSPRGRSFCDFTFTG